MGERKPKPGDVIYRVPELGDTDDWAGSGYDTAGVVFEVEGALRWVYLRGERWERVRDGPAEGCRYTRRPGFVCAHEIGEEGDAWAWTQADAIRIAAEGCTRSGREMIELANKALALADSLDKAT